MRAAVLPAALSGGADRGGRSPFAATSARGKKIPPERVLAHSDIAPARKSEPGEQFPWRRLHDAGVGLGRTRANSPRPGLSSPARFGPPVAALQHMLAAYGYGVGVTGAYDDATRAAVAAFQRHFRPEPWMGSRMSRRWKPCGR